VFTLTFSFSSRTELNSFYERLVLDIGVGMELGFKVKQNTPFVMFIEDANILDKI
jgi:hypothetical protein